MSIIKHVTLQKIVAYDFRYDPRIIGDSGRTVGGDCRSTARNDVMLYA